MSTGLSKLQRLFNPDQARSRKVPRREKIVMGILDPEFPLSDEDEEYKSILIQAFSIMSTYPLMADQVKMIQEISDYSRAWCYNIISDAQYVFGQISTVNKTYLRNAQRERILKAITLMTNAKKPDYFTIAKYEEILMKLYNLPHHIDGKDDAVDEKETYVIPVIEFTDDPAALMSNAEIDEEE